MKIGINPLSWMNSDFPGLGENIAVEQALSEASLIGYKGVELEDPMRRRASEMPGLLKERGLTLIGGWHSTQLLENSLADEFDFLERHMELLDSMGSKLVILGECSHAIHRDPSKPLRDRPRLDKDEWMELAEDLDALFEFIRSQGFEATLHQHMGTPIQSEGDVDRLLELTESVSLLLDTGHLIYAGSDPLQVLKKHRNRINHVHCKNVRRSRLDPHLEGNSSFMEAVLDGVFTTPGDDGQSNRDGYDFYPLIKTLSDGGYTGWIVVEAEQDPQKAKPITYAELGYCCLKHLLKKVELQRDSVKAIPIVV